MPPATEIDRFQYRLTQAARVVWYGGLYATGMRASGDFTPEGEPQFRASAPTPKRDEMIGEISSLFKQDWQNIQAGYYAGPERARLEPLRALRKARSYFSDLPKLDQRRVKRGGTEIRNQIKSNFYPEYYLQNFHYQTDGYLSDSSAELYDTQVEILFAGTADAMRRQALVPLYHALQGKDQREMQLLDVASGTGRFLKFVKTNYPKLHVTGQDLSEQYLAKLRKNLKSWSGVDTLHGNAESMAVDDASFDVVTNIYLFHELPQDVRRIVAREIYRVLKPGGTFIFVDSIQTADTPNLDALLEYFPVGLHEPYYANYLGEDLTALFGGVGLELVSQKTAFLSKILAFRKIGA